MVGLYVDRHPPTPSSCSSARKGQIKALDRAQPGLPDEEGSPGRHAPLDYKRHGTTTLFAALDVLEGKVIGKLQQRHRHREFTSVSSSLSKHRGSGRKDPIRVVLDVTRPHKRPRVRAWLARHERFVFHFTPTSCSWLNAVEGYFAKLSKQRLKRGVANPSSISRPLHQPLHRQKDKPGAKALHMDRKPRQNRHRCRQTRASSVESLSTSA